MLSFYKSLFSANDVAFESVDFRSRLLAFHGAGGEPHSNASHLSVSPARLSRRSLAPSTPINCQRCQELKATIY
jgi:hypothetical protein